MSENCIFCQMVKGEIPCHLIDENTSFMAFLTIFPNTLGASVVIPKQHYSSYAFELDDQVLTDLLLYTKQVALKLDRYFEDVGRTGMVFEGFGVDHVHAKLFPMHHTQGIHENWQPVNSSIDKYFDAYEGYISSHDAKRADDQELAQLAEAIRSLE
ncbi:MULTISPECIES: HIT family protein [unclassified Acinetobacter]|uniref:HIT family protein n=1 Tax=unclassified Acinetobacter TaxID=196816 RepID=UPI001C240C11|nr:MULTISPECIES: HIT domain-containing protein [unclassified Acinetobacter]